MWFPILHAFSQAQLGFLAQRDPSMRANFAGSAFAACTFNFGPRAITGPHVDYGNFATGQCAITALGDYDPDFGGHLILWDLRIVVRFPPGSTILIPSAILMHSNVPIRSHERRSSFTQYSAGGLFRWVRNGFKTDEAFEASASREEMESRAEEDSRWWDENLSMFPCIDSL